MVSQSTPQARDTSFLAARAADDRDPDRHPRRRLHRRWTERHPEASLPV